jgi:DNA-binding GntR family transcriptional regulator
VRELERRTLAEQVYQSLRTAILDDEFPPGAELQETALAERYAVSRGPVREALRLLRADGLVTIVPRMGARVRSLSPEDFRGVYQVRAVLEELAVRLAVPRLTEAQMDELGAYLDTISRASRDGDPVGVFEANTAFHLMFITHSGNVALEAAYGQVRDLISRYQRRSLALRGGMSTLGDEHRLIYEAAVNRDADEAGRRMKQHILLPTARVDDLPQEALAALSEVLGADVQL